MSVHSGLNKTSLSTPLIVPSYTKDFTKLPLWSSYSAIKEWHTRLTKKSNKKDDTDGVIDQIS